MVALWAREVKTQEVAEALPIGSSDFFSSCAAGSLNVIIVVVRPITWRGRPSGALSVVFAAKSGAEAAATGGGGAIPCVDAAAVFVFLSPTASIDFVGPGTEGNPNPAKGGGFSAEASAAVGGYRCGFLSVLAKMRDSSGSAKGFDAAPAGARAVVVEAGPEPKPPAAAGTPKADFIVCGVGKQKGFCCGPEVKAAFTDTPASVLSTSFGRDGLEAAFDATAPKDKNGVPNALLLLLLLFEVDVVEIVVAVTAAGAAPVAAAAGSAQYEVRWKGRPDVVTPVIAGFTPSAGLFNGKGFTLFGSVPAIAVDAVDGTGPATWVLVDGNGPKEYAAGDVFTGTSVAMVQVPVAGGAAGAAVVGNVVACWNGLGRAAALATSGEAGGTTVVFDTASFVIAKVVEKGLTSLFGAEAAEFDAASLPNGVAVAFTTAAAVSGARGGDALGVSSEDWPSAGV